VVATGLSKSELDHLQEQSINVPIIASDSFGMFGWIINALGNGYDYVTHDLVHMSHACSENKDIKTRFKEDYPPFQVAFGTTWVNRGQGQLTAQRLKKLRRAVSPLYLGIHGTTHRGR
jgi:hypothetical protein